MHSAFSCLKPCQLITFFDHTIGTYLALRRLTVGPSQRTHAVIGLARRTRRRHLVLPAGDHFEVHYIPVMGRATL